MGKSDAPYRFDDTASNLWQDKMDDIHSFYLAKIKVFICLALKKNLTSKIVYEIGINCVKELNLSIYDPVLKKTYYPVDVSGIEILSSSFQFGRKRWDEYSCELLCHRFADLQVYFDHLKDENLHKKLKGEGNS